MKKTNKMKPYCGENDEIFEGKKSIITIHDSYFEYKIDYKQKVILEKCEDENCKNCIDLPKESVMINKQQGFILKDQLSSVSKYVETGYNSNGEPFEIHMIDVEMINSASVLTLNGEDESDVTELYNSLRNWKLNIVEKSTKEKPEEPIN